MTQHAQCDLVPAVLTVVAGLFLITGAAQASDRQGNYTEEFHKVYPSVRARAR